MPRRGLPQTITMRHDEHYVEALAASAGAPIGRLVPIDRIDPNPHQPRQVMGDLSELIASISEKGILEPLVVRQRGDRFQIVAGELAVAVFQRQAPRWNEPTAAGHEEHKGHKEHEDVCCFVIVVTFEISVARSRRRVSVIAVS